MLLEAREVTAGYCGVPAIRGVSLTVEPGEVVALLGPNGTGKTTTLMALAGALTALAGEVRWRGKATTRPLHGRSLELFPELGGALRRRAGLLSGGQQQMLTLARALSRRPDCLLADELSLGLAPALVRRLLTAVRAAADTGVADRSNGSRRSASGNVSKCFIVPTEIGWARRLVEGSSTVERTCS